MMKITISNKIKIENPSPELLKYAKQELEIPNPEFQKKFRMGLWTGGTPPKLILYEKSGSDLILPWGTIRDVVSLATGAAFEVSRATIANPHYLSRIEFGTVDLYDYQKKAVRTMVMQIFSGGILQAPPGSGKTQMGLAIAAVNHRKTLWLTHTKDLLLQSKERAERYFDPAIIGTITEGKVNIGTGITFATVQTMARLDLPQYKNEWDLVIVDECHRVAGTPTALTMFAKVLGNLDASKVGLSATVHRADGLIKATFALIGPVVYEVPEEEVADTVMPVHVVPVETKSVLTRQAQNTDGTLNYAGLINSLCEDEDRNKLIKSLIEGDVGHSILVLSDRLEHLVHLQDMLSPELKDQSVFINGKMTSKVAKAARVEAIRDMRAGVKKILFATYSLAKEGLDIPILDRLILATPQSDSAIVEQSLGRIARKAPEKESPVCYDIVDSRISYLANAFRKRSSTYKKKKYPIG